VASGTEGVLREQQYSAECGQCYRRRAAGTAEVRRAIFLYVIFILLQMYIILNFWITV
jgi:hypothetical protein